MGKWDYNWSCYWFSPFGISGLKSWRRTTVFSSNTTVLSSNTTVPIPPHTYLLTSLPLQLREERKQELTEHVSAINAALRAAGDPDVLDSDSDPDAWNGISDDETPAIQPPVLNHEEEYASEDEDKYTTVTIEAVDVTKEGLLTVGDDDEDEDGEDGEGKGKKGKWSGKDGEGEGNGGKDDGKKKWPKKPRKQKFRYESKVERKATRMKQKSKNKASADARKGGG